MKKIKSLLLIILIVSLQNVLAQKNDSLLAITKSSANDTMKVKALNQLGLNYFFKSDLKTAKLYLTQSLLKAEKIQYKRGEAVANTVLSGIAMYSGDNGSVFKYSYKALEIYKEINDTTCQNFMSNLNNIATVYDAYGEYNKSLEFYLRALKISEITKINNFIISININIASLYTNKSEYDKAITYYTTAFKATNKNEDTLSNYPNIFLGFGDIYLAKKDFDKSLYYYQRFLNISNAINDTGYVCSANIGIANVYKERKDYNTAIKYLNESLLFKDNERNATAYLSLGDIYVAQKNYKLAKECFDKSLSLGKKIQFKNIICLSYKNLSMLDSCTNNFSSSMQNYKLYIVYRDSLYNVENERKMVSTELNYNFDKEKSLIKFQQEEKNKINELNNNRKNLIITGIIVLLIILIIFSVFIYKSYLGKNKANKLISHQKHLVEEKQKEILDNITYAKRIQSSIMPTQDYINKYSNNFVMYQPKDIVSGDFFWATELDGKFYLATSDCTGHGVSGSMMSMLNISALNETVNHRKISNTGDILNDVRKEIVNALNPKGDEGVNDGMDCVLCAFDFENKTLQYSAANNSFYIIRNNELITCKADKMPIGLSVNNDSFKTNEFQLQSNDVVYMFTDGYADQFGGKNGKKFKYKQLEQLLLSISHLSMTEQRNALNKAFNDWKGDTEQTDDVLIIGIRVN